MFVANQAVGGASNGQGVAGQGLGPQLWCCWLGTAATTGWGWAGVCCVASRPVGKRRLGGEEEERDLQGSKELVFCVGLMI